MSEYLPPKMSNGKTWADSDWWAGKSDHNPPTVIHSFDDAERLTWARCRAYGEAMGMTTREWHLMWPIVYAALNACSRIPTPAPPDAHELAA